MKTNKQFNYILGLLVTVFASFSLSQSEAAKPSDYGLKEGDVISAIDSGDPDVYIVNDFGYKRLFVNPEIFNLYGHLGWDKIKKVSPETRDAFVTSGLFRNCESGDEKVYGLDVVNEDVANLRWVNSTGSQAVADDADFFKKVFCINNKEVRLYGAGSQYSSVRDIPKYERGVALTNSPTSTSTPSPQLTPTQPESLYIGYVTPNRIPSNSGVVDVSIIGTGFKNGATVDVGIISKPLTTFVSSKQLIARIPGSLDPGSYDLIVINPSGENITLKNALTIQVPPTPASITIAQIRDIVSPSVVKIVCNTSIGSGFVFDNAGFIITNDHVVSGCNTVEVKLKNNTLTGQVLGTNAIDDVAVIKVSQNIQALVLGESSESVLPVGSRIFVFGYPKAVLNIDSREGIISSSGQPCIGINTSCAKNYLYLTTNAATESGGSGGPWVNEKGEVIGILRGGYSTLDFGIPMSYVKTIIPALKAGTSTPAPSATPISTSTPTPTPTPTPIPIVPGSMTVSVAPSTLSDHTVWWGYTGDIIGKWQFNATNEGFSIEKTQFRVTDVGEQQDAMNNIKTLYLEYKNKAGTVVTKAGTLSSVASIAFGFVGDDRPYVPKNGSLEVTLKADFKTKAEGATNTNQFNFSFMGDSGIGTNTFRAVGEGSGTVLNGNSDYITDQVSTMDVMVYRIFPEFTIVPSTVTKMSTTDPVLTFKITAKGLSDSKLLFDNLAVVPGSIRFEVVASGVISAADTTFTVIDASDNSTLDTGTITDGALTAPRASLLIDFGNKNLEITGGSSKTIKIFLDSVAEFNTPLNTTAGLGADYFGLVLRDNVDGLISWTSDNANVSSLSGFLRNLPLTGYQFTAQ